MHWLGLLTITGFIILVIRGDILISAYLAAVFAAISVAPWPSQFFRYVAPILPLISLGLGCCLHTLFVKAGDVSRSWMVFSIRASIIAILCGSLSVQAASFVIAHRDRSEPSTLRQPDLQSVPYRQIWYGAPDIALDAALEWVAQHAGPHDVIAASMPHWAYLRTGLKSVMPPFEEPEAAQRLLDSVPVRYLFYENPAEHINPSSRYMSELVSQHTREWRLVFADPHNYVRVYERSEYASGAKA